MHDFIRKRVNADIQSIIDSGGIKLLALECDIEAIGIESAVKYLAKNKELLNSFLLELVEYDIVVKYNKKSGTCSVVRL